jgi:hypothetical protein
MPWRLRSARSCPACGLIVASAVYRRWPGTLTLTASDGRSLAPMSSGLLRRLAEQELVSAAPGARRSEAEARLAFLDRNLGELTFDLACPLGHRTLRTMPQVVRAVRRAPGAWVSLTPAE